jgi:hypothetical protein
MLLSFFLLSVEKRIRLWQFYDQKIQASSLQSFLYGGEASTPEIDIFRSVEKTPRLAVENVGFKRSLVQLMNANLDIRKFYIENVPARIFVYVLFAAVLTGCQMLSLKIKSSPQDCIEQMAQRLENLTEKKYLNTLDGQQVELQEFFEKCSQNWPYCVLYPKFYYWKTEIKSIESKSETGIVQHKIRMYYNLLSTCHPEKVDTGRTHGDVVEFYDTGGVFMGLGVYIGKGLYWPLPYSQYKGKKNIYFYRLGLCTSTPALNRSVIYIQPFMMLPSFHTIHTAINVKH